MKNHTNVGKALFWSGFLLFLFGFTFSQLILDTDSDPSFHPIPIAIGIILLLSSHFFKTTTKK